uniref:Poly [ADP-ribose] polymerase n=1 Tax=Romanomermis culicivorax TaxID=13658 RepID=A0A915HZI7_ROMCU
SYTFLDNIPLEWDWQEGDNIENATYNLVRLNSDSEEYRTVRNAALQTSPNLAISQIERVENPTRFQQYALAKKQVEKIVRDGHPCERMLFHGTAPDRVPGICAGCFDRSLSGVNGD